MSRNQPLLLTSAVISLLAISSRAQAEPPPRPSHIGGVIRVHRGDSSPAPETTRQTQTGTALLSYGGGPVIPNAKVVVLLWGTGVDPDVVSEVAGFFGAISVSPWMDVMAEYSTPQQTIGHGSFVMTVTDPSPIINNTVTDTQIQQEVVKALNHLNLPAPDENTIYFVLFPPGITISSPGLGSSCEVFCAYHADFTFGQQDVYYAVIPDQGGTCSFGCGTGTKVENTESSMSHEYAEAITDPAPNSAWFDANSADLQGGGEIGDICATGFRETGVVSGYTVQHIWSNEAKACVTIHPPGGNDYSVVAAPTSTSLALGATTTVMINTAVTTGVAEPITLTASGLSTGLTATFNPAMINSGGSSTLTLTAAANAQQLKAAVDINAAVTDNYSHDTPLTVTVGTPGDFSISLDPRTQTTLVNNTVTYTVNVAAVTQPIDTVDLSGLNPPAGFKMTFNPPTVAVGHSSTMTLAIGNNVTSGDKRFTVQGAAGATLHQVVGTVLVEVPDASIPDARPPAVHFDAKPSPGTDTPAASCALASPGATGRGAGALVALVFGVAVIARRRFSPRS